MLDYEKWKYSDEGIEILIKFNHEAKDGEHLENWWKKEYKKLKEEDFKNGN